MRNRALVFGSLLAASLLFGCGDDEDSNNNAPATQDVTLNFAAFVNGQPFECGVSYTLGSAATPVSITDIKFYVSEVFLVDADGNETAVTLANDGKWQNGVVALLDFEDASTGCDNGTTDTNSQVVGTVAQGEYVGVKFSLGVPFDQNHQDAAVAEAPLNLTSMFWNWQGGYKFLRIDGQTDTGGGFRVHLGSTMCQMEEDSTEVTGCMNPNRPVIELPYGETLALNVDRFFEDEDMTPDGENNSTICMSGPDFAACNSVFEKMNLSFGNNSPQAQVIFEVEE